MIYLSTNHKIDGTTTDDAEDWDLLMMLYNILEHSSNYSDATRVLWFHSKNKRTNIIADTANIGVFKSFNYKAKLIGNNELNETNGTSTNTTIVVPLKYLGNFLRSLEMPLVNCKIELKLELKQIILLCL